MSAPSREVSTAVNGLLLLGVGALFVGIPAVVIGLFQSPRVAMAGAGYAVLGTLSALSARSLHRRLNVRFGIVVVLVFLAVMALRFAFYPVQFPLALIEGVLALLAFVSLLQLTSLLRLTSADPSSHE